MFSPRICTSALELSHALLYLHCNIDGGLVRRSALHHLPHVATLLPLFLPLSRWRWLRWQCCRARRMLPAYRRFSVLEFPCGCSGLRRRRPLHKARPTTRHAEYEIHWCPQHLLNVSDSPRPSTPVDVSSQKHSIMLQVMEKIEILLKPQPLKSGILLMTVIMTVCTSLASVSIS